MHAFLYPCLPRGPVPAALFPRPSSRCPDHPIVQCAPMRVFSRLWLLALVLLVACTARDAAAQSRTARTIRFDSIAMGGQATVAVLLPVEYDSSTARYPVLYLLHGGTQNHTAFPSRAWFPRDASERRMIVVMPHLQPVFFTARGNSPAPVEEFLGRELPAYIDSQYRTVNDRRARAVA